MNAPTIGFIGTGIMGRPMARNLMRAGHSLIVFNRTRIKAAELLQEGARWADTPADVARHAETIVSIVSDSPDVESVYLGPAGVCAALQKDSLCIDMSTVSPDTASTVAQAVEQRGGAFLDAPVSGGKTGAEAGTLSIMVGGAEADLQRARPIFEAVGKSIIHCGPVGHGQLTKLCNQILCGLNLLAVSEAVIFARKVGLDPHVMLQAVAKGAAGSWALENLGPRMLTRDFKPMFMIDLQQKDLRIALSLGRERMVPLPGTGLVHQLLCSNQAHGEGAEGTQALIKTLERLGAWSGKPPVE